MSIVLAIFFLGLSVGSYLSGKYSHLIKKPLLTYGILEGVIGIYSFFLIYILLEFNKIIAFFNITNSLGNTSTLLKFSLVFLLLLIPTTLMGATLPLLVKSFIKNKENSDKIISVLYSINTLGAAIGALCSGFLLIPNLGITLTNHFMVLINILILFCSYLISKKTEFQSLVTEKLLLEVKDSQTSILQNIILFTCFLSGTATLISEIVWNKYLGIYLGTNIYGLSIILFSYLFGIALGSFALSRFIKKINNKKYFLILIYFLTLFSLYIVSISLNSISGLTFVVKSVIGWSTPILTIKSITSLIILIIPTFLFGISLPLSISLITRNMAHAPKQVGTAYSLNTIGSILGSCFAGLIFIPTFGSSITIKISLSITLVSLLLIQFISFKNKKILISILLFTGLLFIPVWLSSPLTFNNIIKNAYLQYTKEEYVDYNKSKSEEYKLIIEGKTAIISLGHDPADQSRDHDYKKILRLKTNGLNESVYHLNSLNVLPKYEALLGLIPYVLHPNPQNAFVVGLGGGYTVDLLTSSNLKEVDVVELEQGIIDALNYVYKDDAPLLKRKTLNLQIEDARYVLLTNRSKKYDIVVSQPSHSWLSGVANLFTQDFFEIVKSNLSQNGLFSQWLNLYNMDTPVLKSILKTFYTVFPHGLIFTDANDEELIMIGSKTPLSFNIDQFNLIKKNSYLKKNLDLVGIESYETFLTNFSTTRKKIWNSIKDSPINKDDNAFAEVRQTKLFYSQNNKFLIDDFFINHFDGSYSFLNDTQIQKTDWLKLINSLISTNKFEKLYKLFKSLPSYVLTSSLKSFDLANIYHALERYSSAHENYTKAFKNKSNTIRFNSLLKSYHSISQYNKGIQFYNNFKGKKNKESDCIYAMFYVDQKEKIPSRIFSKMFNQYTPYYNFCGSEIDYILGKHYSIDHKEKNALAHLEQYYDNNPTSLKTIKELIINYIRTNGIKNIDFFVEQLKTTQKNEFFRYKTLKDFYLKEGHKEDAIFIDKIMESIPYKELSHLESSSSYQI